MRPRYSRLRGQRPGDEDRDDREERRRALFWLCCCLITGILIALGVLGTIAFFRSPSVQDKLMQLMDADVVLEQHIGEERTERIAADQMETAQRIDKDMILMSKDMDLMTKDMMLEAKDMQLMAKDMNLMDMDAMLQTEIDAIVQVGEILNATQVNITVKLGEIMMDALALGQQVQIVFWKACNNTETIAVNEGNLMILNSTCIKTINGAVPENGKIIVSGSGGITITDGPGFNEIHIESSAIQTINGKPPLPNGNFQIFPGTGITISTLGAPPGTITIANTGFSTFRAQPITSPPQSLAFFFPTSTGLFTFQAGTGIDFNYIDSNTLEIAATAPPSPTPAPPPTPAPAPGTITSITAGPSAHPGIQVTNPSGPVVSVQTDLEVSQFTAHWCSAYGDDYFFDWEFTSNVEVTVIRQGRFVTVQFDTSAGDDPGNAFPPFPAFLGPEAGQPIVLCLGAAPPKQDIIGTGLGPPGGQDRCNDVKGTYCTCFDPIRAPPCVPVTAPYLPAFQHVADRMPWDYFASDTLPSADQVSLTTYSGQIRIERAFPVGTALIPMQISGGSFSYVTFA